MCLLCDLGEPSLLGIGRVEGEDVVGGGPAEHERALFLLAVLRHQLQTIAHPQLAHANTQLQLKRRARSTTSTRHSSS